MPVNEQRLRQLLSMEEGDRVRQHMLRRLKNKREQEGDGIFADQHLVTRAMNANHRPYQQRRRTLFIWLFLAVVSLGLIYASVLRRTTGAVGEGAERPAETISRPADGYFSEPETVIINTAVASSKTVEDTKACPTFPTDELLQSPNADSLVWKKLGKELKHSIKESAVANSAGDAVWSNHYGYGNRVALSGDGNQLALSFAGLSGKDKAFGTHIDMFRWNRTAWELVDTLTDVTRGHGHLSHAVHFQSLEMSKDGNRIAFADGHGGVHVMEKQTEGWSTLPSIDIPSLTNATHEQFGTDLAMNCDGSIVAVSGTSPKHSFTQIFRLKGLDWVKIGEIHGKKFGGSITLSSDGSRFVMGTVASESWRGMIQVFDFDGTNWKRVGQPIIGKKSLEMFAGSVDLSKDGNILVGTTKDGNSPRVAAFQLVDNEWKPFGQELQGSGNPHEHYGADVSINGDGTVLAVGAPGDLTIYKALLKAESASTVPNDDVTYQRGRIYLYRMQDGSWERIDHDELKSTVDGDLFGKAVALSDDGRTITGGAPVRKGKSYQHFLGSAKTYRLRSANPA